MADEKENLALVNEEIEKKESEAFLDILEDVSKINIEKIKNTNKKAKIRLLLYDLTSLGREASKDYQSLYFFCKKKEAKINKDKLVDYHQDLIWKMWHRDSISPQEYFSDKKYQKRGWKLPTDDQLSHLMRNGSIYEKIIPQIKWPLKDKIPFLSSTKALNDNKKYSCYNFQSNENVDIDQSEKAYILLVKENFSWHAKIKKCLTLINKLTSKNINDIIALKKSYKHHALYLTDLMNCIWPQKKYLIENSQLRHFQSSFDSRVSKLKEEVIKRYYNRYFESGIINEKHIPDFFNLILKYSDTPNSDMGIKNLISAEKILDQLKQRIQNNNKIYGPIHILIIKISLLKTPPNIKKAKKSLKEISNILNSKEYKNIDKIINEAKNFTNID